MFGRSSGLIPVGDSDFSLSHARVLLNISSFTFQNVLLLPIIRSPVPSSQSSD